VLLQQLTRIQLLREDSMEPIEITDLSKSFKTKRARSVEAVKNLSLTVKQGEVIGFLGPNGAGKSTTIKILMGLIKPTSGQARIMGQDTGSPRARTHVGYLPENPAFYDYLTGEEYLDFVGKIFNMHRTLLSNRSKYVLDLFELWDARKRAIRSYSKGMVQRLGLAQTIIHDPEVYIFDEPMSGLDPIGRKMVSDLILELKSREKTIFFSSHILSDIERCCDKAAIIVEGRLRLIYDLRERGSKNDTLESIFLREAGKTVSNNAL